MHIHCNRYWYFQWIMFLCKYHPTILPQVSLGYCPESLHPSLFAKKVYMQPVLDPDWSGSSMFAPISILWNKCTKTKFGQKKYGILFKISHLQSAEWLWCYYLSFEAFSSRTASLYEAPNIALARHNILVVFPVPGGPYNQLKTEDISEHHNFLSLLYTRIPRKASSHLLGQKSQEPQSERGY